MKIKPYFDRVVIKQNEVQEQSYGNIIVADTGKEKPLIGKVIAVGPGQHTISGTFIPTITRVGDTVMFPSFGGHKIVVDGEDYVVCKEQDLLIGLD
jgi:chaperonin GroES